MADSRARFLLIIGANFVIGRKGVAYVWKTI